MVGDSPLLQIGDFSVAWFENYLREKK